MDVSVIIVNYNVRDFLEGALHSVQKAMNGIEADIYVVDNASQDGSAEMVRTRFQNVHLIASDVNLGFGRANNLAMKQSSARYFLILNPDTIVQEDTLQKMIAFMDEHPDAGMAGCKVLNADGTFQLSCRRGFPTSWASFCKVFGLSSVFPKVKLFAGYNLTYLDENKAYPVDALAGSFMMVRREVFEKTGGFDEKYFMYGEDLDWCYQTQKAGWKVYYTPVTQIIHYKGESAKRSTLDEVKVFYDAMHIFVRKNFSAPLLFILFLRFGIALRSFIALLLKNWRAVILAVLDFLIVYADVLVSTKNRFGGYTALPAYGYPFAVLVPSLVVVAMMYVFSVYGKQWRSLRRTALAVAMSFFVISSLTFFFKEYAFSRQMVLEITVINFVLLCGLRVLLHVRSVAKVAGGGVRKAVIVGSPAQSLQLLKKLRQAGRGFDVIGFVDTVMDTIGGTYEDVKVIGSTQTLAKIVEDQRISDVIFVADAVQYSEMLAAMNRCSGTPVAFRIVPGNADIIVAKAGVDVLDELPVVMLDYNIHKPANKFLKRTFDVVISGALLVPVAPISIFSRRMRNTGKNLVYILRGDMSFVGPSGAESEAGELFGKTGVVSIGELFSQPATTRSQKENYNLYYARNQSLFLDLKILWKAFRNTMTRNTHA